MFNQNNKTKFQKYGMRGCGKKDLSLLLLHRNFNKFDALHKYTLSVCLHLCLYVQGVSECLTCVSLSFLLLIPAPLGRVGRSCIFSVVWLGVDEMVCCK